MNFENFLNGTQRILDKRTHNTSHDGEIHTPFEFSDTVQVGLVLLGLVMILATLAGNTGTSTIFPITLIFFGLELH